MAESCKVTPKPANAKEFFTGWYFWKPFLGIGGGLLAGFLYNFLIENHSVFQLNNDTLSSVLLGGFIGFFIFASPCTRIGK